MVSPSSRVMTRRMRSAASPERLILPQKRMRPSSWRSLRSGEAMKAAAEKYGEPASEVCQKWHAEPPGGVSLAMDEACKAFGH